MTKSSYRETHEYIRNDWATKSVTKKGQTKRWEKVHRYFAAFLNFRAICTCWYYAMWNDNQIGIACPRKNYSRENWYECHFFKLDSYGKYCNPKDLIQTHDHSLISFSFWLKPLTPWLHHWYVFLEVLWSFKIKSRLPWWLDYLRELEDRSFGTLSALFYKVLLMRPNPLLLL